jgi:hypothetical protein
VNQADIDGCQMTVRGNLTCYRWKEDGDES